MIRLRRGPNLLATLSMGDLPIELEVREPVLREILTDRYGAFFTDEIGDLTLEIEPLDRSSSGASPYEPTAALADACLTIESAVLRAEVDFQTGRGTIAVDIHGSATQYYLENALRQIVQVLALERDAILMHAAAVAPPSRDRVFLFAGRSGAGKSTISGILADVGGTVFSDDLVLLETRGDGPRIVSTPFYGTLPPTNPEPLSLPLTAAYLLEQAPVAELSDPAPRAEGVAALMTNVPFTAPLDPSAHGRAMEVLSRTTRVVPVRTLRFRRDDSMCSLIGWGPVCEGMAG